jgi:transposase
VIDIPAVVAQVKEHQIFGKRCTCGHITRVDYPTEAHSPVCYGNNIQAAATYLHARQYIPFERMREMFRDLFGLHISSGCLSNMIQKTADKATAAYETIHQKEAKSAVIGADKTGTCINGKNRWSWVFQTIKATFIHTDTSRGKAVIDKLFPDGFSQSVLVHDCWTPYFKVHTEGHQICTAHLLRELNYLSKLYSEQTWTKDFTTLLENALDLKRELTPAQFLQPIPQRTTLETRLTELLNQVIDPKYEKLITFKKRMIKYRDYLFAFLYHWQVPAGNNGAEKAVRTFKVKQKVSGLFRSQEGAKAFDILRSLIDTTIKNNQNVMRMLYCTAALKRY